MFGQGLNSGQAPPVQFHVPTFKATVFRRTLPGMLGTWPKNDFKTGSVVLIPFFLLHMHVHGVVHNKQTMPCIHRKPKTTFKNQLFLKGNPAPKMKTNRNNGEEFLLSSLGETAEEFGETAGQTADDFGEILYFWHEINTFLIQKIIWAQMKTCYNLPVCGHQSEKIF